MNTILSFVLGAIAIGQASVALAQSGNLIYEAVANAPVGSWAEYTLSFAKTGEKKTQRYSLVEKTAARVVLEIETELSIGAAIMHLEYVPAGTDGWSLFKGTLQTPTGKLMALPTPSQGESALIKKGVGLGRLLGKESVKTPIGTIECSHWLKKTKMGSVDVITEFWTNDTIFPIGLARSVIAAKGMEVVLSAVGKGAKAKSAARPGRASDILER